MEKKRKIREKQCMMIAVGLILLLLLWIIILFFQRYTLYWSHKYAEEYFGKELYSEVLHICSKDEKDIGNMIVDKAIGVSQYAGEQELSKTKMGDVGALSEYYYFSRKNAVRQDVEIRFITCKITGKEGHVWVTTKGTWYDSNGEKLEGMGIAPALWHIEKQGNEWYVVEVEETP